MSYSLISKTTHKARKAHRCIWCGDSIPVGELYTKEFSYYDGQSQDHKWHNDCNEAADAYFRDGFDDDFLPHSNERPVAA